MKRNIAVVLSGCGHKDGAEITEAVSALVAISETGANYQVFAPNMQFNVVGPISGEETIESRSVLREAARISRGEIQPLEALKTEDFDALAIPGGAGVILNLCTWAKEGAKCSVLPEVKRVITEFYAAQKPIAAICIAPTLIARVLGSKGVTLTIGHDIEVAAEVQKTGAIHETCKVEDFISDREHRIVTTPAYMYADAKPHQVFTGVRAAIREMVEMS